MSIFIEGLLDLIIFSHFDCLGLECCIKYLRIFLYNDQKHQILLSYKDSLVAGCTWQIEIYILCFICIYVSL